ncbi:MAG: sulfotransferase, partial [Anaerolineales bacterium]
PNIILADEIGALDYASAGFKRSQIFHMLLKGSRRELMKGRVTARRLTPYSYLVPGQWQGRFTKLQVIGDGKAGSSTQHFARDPQLLSQLLSVMADVDVKLIQVVRNPFDVISVMMVRGKRTFANSINHYFTNCENLIRLRNHMRINLLAVHYEDFVTYPVANLTPICEYLDVEPHPDYLQACAGIMHETPDLSRHMVEWTPKWKKVVEDNLARYDFLQGYNFES